MATQKKNNSLSIVTMANGKMYLGELHSKGISNALALIDDKLSKHTFRNYLLKRNLGELKEKTFSAVADYDAEFLNADQEAEFEFVAGMFRMAQGKAKAYMENQCFSDLYGGK